jgi:hypothetical protein
MAKIEIRSTLNSDQYRRGIADMQSRTRSFGSGLSGLKNTIRNAFSIAGVMALAAGIKSVATRLFDYASKIKDLSEQTRLSTDEVQALDDAFIKAGVDVELLRTMMTKISIAMAKHKQGSKAATEAFKALGISQEQVDKSSPAEMLEILAKKMSKAEAGSVAYASALEIIGTKSGTKLEEVLEEIANVGLQGMIDKSKEAGRVMSEELLNSLDTAKDKIDLLGKRMTIWAAESIGFIERVAASWGAFSVGDSFQSGWDQIDNENRAKAQEAKRQEEARVARAKAANEAESTRIRAKRAAEEEAKKQKKLQDIEDSVKLEIEPADKFRKMGGSAGNINSMAIAMERRKLEIAQKQADYLKEIVENTEDMGGLAE